ncbi:hypothetical protein [Streptomyces aureus]|uniref:Uncharacterized protein n=1 Tax=Streptomyces aureus TaxID=193461 RepID=A0ABV4SHK7_9ACTN
MLPVRQLPVPAVDACDERKVRPAVLGTDVLKGVEGFNYLKNTHVVLEMPRREDFFMSTVANCCAEHGALSPEERALPVSTGDPCARVLCHQFPPVTGGLQLSGRGAGMPRRIVICLDGTSNQVGARRRRA